MAQMQQECDSSQNFDGQLQFDGQEKKVKSISMIYVYRIVARHR